MNQGLEIDVLAVVLASFYLRIDRQPMEAGSPSRYAVCAPISTYSQSQRPIDQALSSNAPGRTVRRSRCTVVAYNYDIVPAMVTISEVQRVRK